MSELIGQSELVCRALAFILERVGANESDSDTTGARAGRGRRAAFVALCDEASMRYNLSPQDALSLSRVLDRYCSGKEQGDAAGKNSPQDSNA